MGRRVGFSGLGVPTLRVYPHPQPLSSLGEGRRTATGGLPPSLEERTPEPVKAKSTRLRRSPLWLTLATSLTLTAGLSIAFTIPGFAHQVQLGETVGGTLHLEPNDTPRAQAETLIWLALTRQGGQTIPLDDCNCLLRIYQAGNAQMLAQPSLQPISAEGHEDIPSATFTFPAVGAYTLVFAGSPQNEAEFSPFELSYTVTVAAAAQPQPSPPPTTPLPTAIETPTPNAVDATIPSPLAPRPHPMTLVAVSLAISSLALGFWYIRRRR